MKKFLKNLAIGLAIAVLAAVAICYAVWSFHSMHRIIWLVIIFIYGCYAYQYLSEPDFTTREDADEMPGSDHDKFREKTLSEKVGTLAQTSVGLLILGALVWAIGYGVESWLGLPAKFWEMDLLYGAGTIFAVYLLVLIGCHIWIVVTDWKHYRPKFINALKWLVITLCGLALAAVILYYLFPWALRH